MQVRRPPTSSNPHEFYIAKGVDDVLARPRHRPVADAEGDTASEWSPVSSYLNLSFPGGKLGWPTVLGSCRPATIVYTNFTVAVINHTACNSPFSPFSFRCCNDALKSPKELVYVILKSNLSHLSLFQSRNLPFKIADA